MTHIRSFLAWGLALVMAGALSATAQAQLLKLRGPSDNKTAAAAKEKEAKPAETPAAVAEFKSHLVSPSDPIAVVNGEPVTRGQLADECVAQKGQEILETLIARKLIDQAIHAKKIEVTSKEVDAEIDRIAENVAGVSRERWLATLSKERKISPARYARDVIYPSLALRKLATPLVQVSDQDMKDAFAAQFGEQIKCRMILLNDQRIALQVWEDVKKNPSIFEKVAQTKSIDPTTRAVGGMLPDPITRHAYPRPVSDKIFAQLVDVDSKIDPKSSEYAQYKPKDGDISGIIQVTEMTWAVFQRVSVVPARPYDEKSPILRKQIEESLFEAKVNEKINDIVGNMMRDAAIENRLTGQVKLSREEEMHVPGDANVKRSAATAGDLPPVPTESIGPEPSKPPTGVPAGTMPAGLSAADAQRAKSLEK